MAKKQSDETIEVTINSLGAMGDGLTEHKGQRLYVPYSCVGDRLRISPLQPKAKILEVIEAAPDRVTPPCQHFGQCGGCSFQHLKSEKYEQFKSDTLRNILKHLNVDASIMQPLMTVGEKSRRRVELKVEYSNKQLEIGFYEARSHQLIALEECLVVESEIFALLPSLKQCLSQLSKPAQIQSVSLTQLEKGGDVIIRVSQPLNSKDGEQLTQWGKANRILRICEDFEGYSTIYDSAQAYVSFGEVKVPLPVSAFLQASKQAEQVILSYVMQHLKGCEHVVDLYSGCGTYSFPLLQQVEFVTAIEGDAAMVKAMQKASAEHPLAGRIKALTRDLYRSPLKAKELKLFDGVVINPPRNGALPQVEKIAKTNVSKIAMVSCNPRSFQRDAKALLAAGYRMVSAVPIDQFYWTSHLEIVACFEKA